MSQPRILKLQVGVVLSIVTVLFALLVLLGGARLLGGVRATSSPPATIDAAPSILSLSEALGRDQPILLVFMPEEQCQIQYCVTADLLARRLAGQGISIVDVPVYAVSATSNGLHSTAPFIGWGVYLVEPYVGWLPQFSEGEYGYGLQETAVTLVDANRQVVFRSAAVHDVDAVVEEVFAHATPVLMTQQSR